MPGAAEIRWQGRVELEAAFLQLRREVLLELKPELVALAERVKGEATSRAPDEITNIGTRWSQFRIGVSTRTPLVYLAPKARRRSGTPRPNLGGELVTLMQEALDHHSAEIVTALDALVDANAVKAGF